MDALPEEIKNSSVLTGNDLGKLGNVEKIPQASELEGLLISVSWVKNNKEDLHKVAHQLLEENKVMEAWKVLLKY